MKQKISPAVVIVAVVVLLAIVAFAGFKTLGPQSSGPNPYSGKGMTPGQAPGQSYQEHGPAGRPPMPSGGTTP